MFTVRRRIAAVTGSMEHVYYDGGVVLVKRVPQDGHCLFSSIVHQHYKEELGTEEHYRKVMELRKKVVEHIGRNYDEFYESLADTVENMNHLGPANIESRIPLFLQRLKETNEWGGQESIAAAAQILNRRIDVYYEAGPLIVFNRSATQQSSQVRLGWRTGPLSGRESQLGIITTLLFKNSEPLKEMIEIRTKRTTYDAQNPG